MQLSNIKLYLAFHVVIPCRRQGNQVIKRLCMAAAGAAWRCGWRHIAGAAVADGDAARAALHIFKHLIRRCAD